MSLPGRRPTQESHSFPCHRVTKVCVEMVPPSACISEWLRRTESSPTNRRHVIWMRNSFGIKASRYYGCLFHSKTLPILTRLWPEVVCSNISKLKLQSSLHSSLPALPWALLTLLRNTAKTLKMSPLHRPKQRDGYEFITPPLYSPFWL